MGNYKIAIVADVMIVLLGFIIIGATIGIHKKQHEYVFIDKILRSARQVGKLSIPDRV